jgi:hypothetical protein
MTASCCYCLRPLGGCYQLSDYVRDLVLTGQYIFFWIIRIEVKPMSDTSFEITDHWTERVYWCDIKGGCLRPSVVRHLLHRSASGKRSPDEPVIAG